MTFRFDFREELANSTEKYMFAFQEPVIRNLISECTIKVSTKNYRIFRIRKRIFVFDFVTEFNGAAARCTRYDDLPRAEVQIRGVLSDRNSLLTR